METRRETAEAAASAEREKREKEQADRAAEFEKVRAEEEAERDATIAAKEAADKAALEAASKQLEDLARGQKELQAGIAQSALTQPVPQPAAVQQPVTAPQHGGVQAAKPPAEAKKSPEGDANETEASTGTPMAGGDADEKLREVKDDAHLPGKANQPAQPQEAKQQSAKPQPVKPHDSKVAAKAPAEGPRESKAIAKPQPKKPLEQKPAAKLQPAKSQEGKPQGAKPQNDQAEGDLGEETKDRGAKGPKESGARS